MIVIYTKRVTNRVKYIFEHIFQNILNCRVEFNNQVFDNEKSITISYGIAHPNAQLFFPSVDLLFEEGVREQNIEVGFDNDLPIFFKTNDKKQAINFDIFAAAFYFLSRYEEYLPYTPDEHDRFPARESLAYKNSFIDKAVVDAYIDIISKCILEINPYVPVKRNTKFNILPTIDVDIPFAYKGRKWKGIPQVLKDLLLFKFEKLAERLKVLRGKREDPYDNFDDIVSIIHQYGHDAIFFFLMENKGKYNNPVFFEIDEYQSIIKKLNQKKRILLGLHPAYNSEERAISAEKERLETITQKKVVKSRQHYLKIHLPNVYRNLIKVGIKEDYSMAFPDIAGFRASTCHPFLWYDILKEETTPLKIFPFVAMDATWKYYDLIDETAILKEINTLKEEVKKYEGFFIVNFHNDILSEQDENGIFWMKIFKFCLK